MSSSGLAEKTVILFDLGGVLVDLGNPSDAMGLEMTADDFWHEWLRSPAVHSYETGRITSAEFFEKFGPTVGIESPKEFASRFQRWQLNLYPGIEALIRSAAKTHRLALLSNTNVSHWQYVLSQTQIFSLFSDVFLSYEIGHLKPASDAFEYVLTKLGCNACSVLFLDDTEKNVHAARQVGIEAVLTHGADGVSEALRCQSTIGLT